MSLNPFVSGIIGAAIAVGVIRHQDKKKAKKSGKKKSSQKALPAPEEVYSDPDLPDVIESGQNSRFTIRLYDSPQEGKWVLVGAPADGSIKHVGTRRSGDGSVNFDFQTVKSGAGAIVIHLRSVDNPNEPQPAIDIVDIQTRVK